MQKHMSMCEHCITRQMTDAEMGLEIDSSKRCEVGQIDRCVLTKEGATQAGHAAVLSIVDVATKFTVFCAAEGQTTLETT